MSGGGALVNLEQASKTALLVAACRALGTARTPPLCNDPWAAGLAGAESAGLAAAVARSLPGIDLGFAARTAFLDAEIRRFRNERPQLVLLGAGLDTRAARLGDGELRCFEADHPLSLADKQRRIS